VDMIDSILKNMM